MTIPASRRGRSSGSEGMDDWLVAKNAILVGLADAALPARPGKYAFHVKSLDLLPVIFREAAADRSRPTLLYIGKADVSLHERVWFQECQHRRPGTFFRSVGAMLGFRSPTGRRNYEFAPNDKLSVIDWIAKNLTIGWTTDSVEGSHRTSEGALIHKYAPLLNIQNNPQKIPELLKMRAICRLGISS
jgi:hypothetical protein